MVHFIKAVLSTQNLRKRMIAKPPPPSTREICTTQQVPPPKMVDTIGSSPFSYPSTLPSSLLQYRSRKRHPSAENGFIAVVLVAVAALWVFLSDTLLVALNRSGACTHVNFICGLDLGLNYRTHSCGLVEIEVEILAHGGDRCSARNVLQGFPLVPLL